MDIKASEYPLFNVKTREKELIDDDLVGDAILGGTHSFPAGARVPVFDPDGRKATIGAEELRAALKEGFRVIGPKALAVDEYLKDNDNLSGAAKVFFGQALDEFALGVPELVMDYTEDPFEAAKREAIKKQHDAANVLGGVTGFGLSTLLGPAKPLAYGAKVLSEAGKKAIAARIVRGAGEAGAEKAAGNLLSRLGGKTLDGLTEGVALSLPHAITESAFGDHDAAAESMLYGTLAGGVFGAGLGAASELINAARQGSSRFYSWAEGKPLTGQEVAKRVARTVTGVPEEHIEHLASEENLQRMIRRKPEGGYDVIVPEREAIKDEAEAVLNAVTDNYEKAQLSYAQIQADVNEAFKRELDEISKGSAPEGVIAKVQDYLGKMKEQSGAIRERFDTALTSIQDLAYAGSDPETIRKIPFYIPRETVGKMISSLEAGLGTESAALGTMKGASISPGKRAAMQRLQGVKELLDSYYAKIDDIYGKDMPGVDLLFARNLIRDMDDIADYGLGAGEFDSAVSKTIKTAQHELRQSIRQRLGELQRGKMPWLDNFSHETIKATAKEAEILWDRQIRNAEILAKANQFFQNPVRTANALDAMTGKNFRASEISRALQEVEREVGEPILPLLDEWLTRKDLLRESKLGPEARERVRGALLPDQTEVLMKAKERALQAEEELKPFKGFAGRRLENAINRVDYKNASIEDTRRLERLGELRDKYLKRPDMTDYTPRNFAQEAKDRAVWDSFDQARLNGSRKAVMGGTLGTALFSIFGPTAAAAGGAIGAGAGATLDYYGGKMLRDFIINGNNYRGLLFVEKQLKNAAKRLEGISSAVDNISKRSPFPIERTARLSGIQVILDLKSDITDRRAHWKKIQDKVSELSANPELLTSRVSELSSALTANGAPSIGARYNQKLMKTIQFIMNEMPKSPRGPSPFAPDVKWKPNDYELKLFDDKLEVIADPFSVIDRMKDRSISKGHVKALQEVYPRIYDEIKWRTSEELMKRGASVPRSDRIKLSILFGADFDYGLSPKGILASQAIYQQKQSETEKGLATEQAMRVNVAQQAATPELQRQMRT